MRLARTGGAATRCAADGAACSQAGVEKRQKRGSVRFLMLVLTLILTPWSSRRDVQDLYLLLG